MSDITRIFQALDNLGLVTEWGIGAVVTVTNQNHVTIGLRSPKALKAIADALEASVPPE